MKGSALVRFGEGRNFKTRNVKGTVMCDVGTFGDPAYGIAKHCEVQASNYDDGVRRAGANAQRKASAANSAASPSCGTARQVATYSGTAPMA